MFENLSTSIEKMVLPILRNGDIGDGREITATQRNRIQADFELVRPEDYTFSTTVNYLYNRSKVRLNLFDIINGIHKKENLIELFSFTTEPIEYFQPELEIQTFARAKIVSFAYMLKNKLTEVTVGLYWYRRDSTIPSEYRELFKLDDIKQDVEDLILKYLEWLKPFQGWKAIRDSSIEKLEFPFTPYRVGQREMMAQVFSGAKHGEQRLIEAHTGIGKTMAAIFPAIKSINSGKINRIFYLTARNTGQKVASGAIRILGENGLRLKSVIITAKEKSCIRRDAIRECDDCRYSKGYYSRLIAGLKTCFHHDQMDFELIKRIGKEFLLCPFELSLDLSLYADIIICDYNYVFDPNVYLKRFFAEVEENYLFLVDEAHNLVDRARSMYSAKIEFKTLYTLRKIIRVHYKDLFEQLGSALNILIIYRENCIKSENDRVEQNPPYDLLKQLRYLLTTMDDWLALKEKKRFKKELLEQYFEIRHFLNISEQFDENYCSVHRIKESGFSITLFNINPSNHLKKKFKNSYSSSLFSATVSPHSYFIDLLGLDKNIPKFSLPSPFDSKNLKLLIADSISTKYTKRETSINEVLGAIEAVVTARSGNYMVFFPSYDYMNRIVDIFQKRNLGIETVVQFSGMKEQERAEYLDTFSVERSESVGILVGFAVMGGIFGEGIDLVGNRLNGVVVVGVGLPGLSSEREQIRLYYKNRDEGFDYSYTFPGINKVLQAVGRVIRTTTDRGVVLLIDDRFSTQKYTSLFPNHWNPLYVRSREQVVQVIEEFYKGLI